MTEPSICATVADYGLLADRCSEALVSHDGSVDWLCLPRYDSPPVFGRVLDRGGGHWSIRPAGRFKTERRHLPGTLVLETTFVTSRGVVRLTDAMPFANDAYGNGSGAASRHELMRSVAGLSGEVRLVMELTPHADDPDRIAIRVGVPVRVDGSTLRAAFTVSAGSRVGFSLCWSGAGGRREPTPPERVAAQIEHTVWRSWVEGHEVAASTHGRLAALSAHLRERRAAEPSSASGPVDSSPGLALLAR